MIGPDELRLRESALADLSAAARVSELIELAREWSRLDKSKALRLAETAGRLAREKTIPADDGRRWSEDAAFVSVKLLTELGRGAESAEQARALLDRADSNWTRARAHHLVALSEATLGRAASAREHHERAVEFHELSTSDEVLGLECRFGLAGSLLQLGEIPEGRRIAEAALVSADAAPPALRARLGFLIGQACSAAGDSEGAIRAFDHALVEAREAGDRWTEARVIGQTGRVLSVAGDYGGALDCFESALTMTRDHHDVVMTQALLIQIADALVLMNATEDSEPFLEELLEMCEESGNLYYQTHGFARLAHLEQQRGSLVAAQVAAVRAREVAEQAGNEGARVRAVLALGAIQRSAGEHEPARESFDQVLSWARDHQDHWLILHALLDRAEVELECDETNAAIETATDALEVAGYPKSTARAHGLLSRAHKLRGEFESALEHRERQHELELEIERDNARGRLEIARVRQEVGQARREAEAEVARVQADYRTLVEVSPTGIVQVDSAGRLISVNPAAEVLFGGEDPRAIVGRPFIDAVQPGSERERVEDSIHRVWAGETVEHSFAGANERRYLAAFVPVPDSSGRVRRMLVLCLDETDRLAGEEERRRLQEERYHSSRLEAVGRLAGGVAHDFNNYLTSLYFRPTLIRNELPEVSPELEEQLSEMEVTVQSAAALTQQLLAFSRKQLVRPRVLCVNEVVRRIESMLRLSLSETVDFVLELADSLPPVRIDRGQLEQVLLNLVLNARDALKDGGRITLETSQVAIAPDRIDGPGEARVGPHVRIEVADDGAGIDPEVLPHVFEPFFTTKERDRGTGLGLATVHGIVHQAEGHLEVDTKPGKGTTFAVFLPALEDGDPANGEQQSGARSTAEKGGGETIVLCDDSAGIRSAAGRALATAGYDVTVCSTPREALEFTDGVDRFDLLITDIVLPEMDGLELAAAVREQHPNVSVLFISGYSPEERIREQLARTDHAFQEKPFSPSELLSLVRRLLDGRLAEPSL